MSGKTFTSKTSGRARSGISGLEFKTKVQEAWGTEEPTTRAARAMGVSRRTLQNLFSCERVPLVYIRAFNDARRHRAMQEFREALTVLEAEARTLTLDPPKAMEG